MGKSKLGDYKHSPEEGFEDFPAKERSRYQKGFKTEWRPTRARYWRPLNNNWKRHRKNRYKS